MPFEQALDSGQDTPARSVVAQERQVRIAAQRILAQHLRPGSPPADTFWPHVDLDLTGATLIDFHFERCQVRSAHFTGATFVGDTDFGGTTFLTHAEFDNTVFGGSARFSDAKFVKDARFRDARFQEPVRFRGSTFHGVARFTDSEFLDDVWFGSAVFRGEAWFSRATFRQDIRFPDAAFLKDVKFRGTEFTRPANEHHKLFKGSWARPARHSSWPEGWTMSAVDTRPWPDAGNGWHKLLIDSRRRSPGEQGNSDGTDRGRSS
nr:pentapeptide repeat-containing protein [Amycolatopsis umgeniensis]